MSDYLLFMGISLGFILSVVSYRIGVAAKEYRNIKERQQLQYEAVMMQFKESRKNHGI
tara:strand:+ start:60 stop:233 length:174 start_codon:yes stop_codon:yes gene_type:complete